MPTTDAQTEHKEAKACFSAGPPQSPELPSMYVLGLCVVTHVSASCAPASSHLTPVTPQLFSASALHNKTDYENLFSMGNLSITYCYLPG